MIWQSDSGGPMFKWWSPMSLGVWIITLFAASSCWRSSVPGRRVGLPKRHCPRRRHPRQGRRRRHRLLGLFLAATPGPCWTASNRPLWADTPCSGCSSCCPAFRRRRRRCCCSAGGGPIPPRSPGSARSIPTRWGLELAVRVIWW
jgi:hypothetical protein